MTGDDKRCRQQALSLLGKALGPLEPWDYHLEHIIQIIQMVGHTQEAGEIRMHRQSTTHWLRILCGRSIPYTTLYTSSDC